MPSVFISYSRKDEFWKERLRIHLGVLEKEGLLDIWDESSIAPGDSRLQTIRESIASAKVAILLISADFLTSDFVTKNDVPALLEDYRKKGLILYPVLVEACPWDKVSWLEKLSKRLRPHDGRSLASYRKSRREKELANIAREILALLQNQESPIPPTPVPPSRKPGKTKPSPASDWVKIAGVCFLGVTLFFLMYLVGNPVTCDNRFLVVSILALTVAAGFGFLGGSAALKGSIPLPEPFRGRPMAVSLTGGVSVFVIVWILGWLMYVQSCPGEGPTAKPSILKAFPGLTRDGRAALIVDYIPVVHRREEECFVRIDADEGIAEEVQETKIDCGQGKVSVPSLQDYPTWVKIVVKGPRGVVRKESARVRIEQPPKREPILPQPGSFPSRRR